MSGKNWVIFRWPIALFGEVSNLPIALLINNILNCSLTQLGSTFVT